MDTRTLTRIIVVSLLLLIPFSIWLIPHTTGAVVGFFVFLSPLWLPFLLIAIFVPLWIMYVRSQYVMSIPYVTLELKPGDKTLKTTRAMELIFYSMHHRTSLSRKMEYITGQVRLPWSFDVVASNGTVRFYMRIPKAHRQALEMRIRTEYKDIDIDEVRDYAREVGYESSNMQLKIKEYRLVRPDPYPIKTYEGYEKDDKDEKPFQEILEKLVGIGENEHVFISYMVRPHQRERRKPWEHEQDSLHSDAQQEITSLLGSSSTPRELPEDQQKLIKAIEDALKKPSFDCGVRAVYLAQNNAYKETNADLLDTLLEPFNDASLNVFEAYDPRENVQWPLSDVFSALPIFSGMYFYHLYRRRAYFSPPYYGKYFVLNTAELATVFHLPHIRRSSALARAKGIRLEPPENLPI